MNRQVTANGLQGGLVGDRHTDDSINEHPSIDIARRSSLVQTLNRRTKASPPTSRMNSGTLTHHEVVSRPRQPGIEPLFGALTANSFVHCQHDRTTLKVSEPEHVAVEHLLGVLETVAVHLVALALP